MQFKILGTRTGGIQYPGELHFARRYRDPDYGRWISPLRTGGAQSPFVASGVTLCVGLPLRRAGKPKDIAYAAVYLASNESLYTTGHNLVIESGNTLGRSQAEQDLHSARRKKAVFGSD